MSSALNSALAVVPAPLAIPRSLSNMPLDISLCLTSVEALTIATDEANQDFGDVTHMQSKLTLDVDGWHVDITTPQRNGSRFATGMSLHYLIHATTGEILAKSLYQ